MSTTTSTSTTSSTPTTSASPSSTDDAYTFTFTETEVRNIAMAVGLSLTVLLICALIAIEVMRRKIKRLNRQLSIYEVKGYMSATKAGGYEQIPIGSLESGNAIRAELDGSREVVESDARFLGEQRSFHGRDQSFVLKMDSRPSSPHRSESRERLR